MSVKAGAPAKSAANWIQTELLRRLNDAGRDIAESPVTPAALAELVKLVEAGTVTAAVGKKVFGKMFDTGKPAAEIVAAEGLGGKISAADIERAAREVVEKHPDNVAKYKGGNEGVFKFFVGQVMRAMKGQAAPDLVQRLLQEKLG